MLGSEDLGLMVWGSGLSGTGKTCKARATDSRGFRVQGIQVMERERGEEGFRSGVRADSRCFSTAVQSAVHREKSREWNV